MTHSRKDMQDAVHRVKTRVTNQPSRDALNNALNVVSEQMGCEPKTLLEWIDRAERVPKLMNGGLAVCLSGGGLRATFFHLGVVKLLADIGWLPRVKYVFSVSGGTILAAHMATRWSLYVSGEEAFQKAADELRQLAQRDVRGRVLRRVFRGDRTRLLAREYDYLFGGKTLRDLPSEPDKPEFRFLATGLTTGKLYALHRGGLSYVESDSVGSRDGICHLVEGTEHARLSLAVATSSAFPLFFPPVSTDKLGAPRGDYLSDGGFFDNLGTSRIHLFLGNKKDQLSGFIASDASAWFDNAREPGCLGWRIWTSSKRAVDILMRQAVALEIENWQLDTQATHPLHPIQICQVVKHEEVAPYPPLPKKVQEAVPGVKTDLDFFHTDTLRALVLHGHEVAARSVALSTDPECTPTLPDRPWDPWPGREVERLESVVRSDHRRRWLPWNPRWVGAHRK